jgi:hypothetical protein
MKASIKMLICIFAVAIAFLSCDFGTNSSNTPSGSSSSSEPKCDGTDISLYGFGKPCGCVREINMEIYMEQCGDKKYLPISGYIRCENDVIEAKCGDEWYNPETQFCHEHNILDKCEGEVYYPPDQICENNVIHYYLTVQ